MSQTASPTVGQIHELLAAHRYSVAESADGILSIMEVDSGLTIAGSPAGRNSFPLAELRHRSGRPHYGRRHAKMLASDNGISTSHFQLYTGADGKVTVTLNNFCKLQDLGPDDEDDILSCVVFLMADAVHARELIGQDIQ